MGHRVAVAISHRFTILFGVMLLNFPGKREFELWLVSRKGVLKVTNWMRAKANCPPLQVPDNRVRR